MKVRCCFLLLIVMFSLLLAGCKTNPELEFIQDTWVYHDEHLQNLAGEQHLTAVWKFYRGTFEFAACCFNIDTYQKGKYSVLERRGDYLLLEAFDIEGDVVSLGSEIFIEIDRQNDTLSINGTTPFVRQRP